MELEFDKEIDSLLRKSGEADRGVLGGDGPVEKPKVHLDADQLAAFAENAVPEKSRPFYMSHLADCDSCRRVLSGLITLNAEAEPIEDRVVAPGIVTTSTPEPWYRRLLLPNLAYVMGGLVLVFGGLIAFTVFQSSNNELSMSQTATNVAPAARGPMFESAQSVTDEMANSNASVVASNKPLQMSANTVANAANASGPTGMPALADSEVDDVRKESKPGDGLLGGVDAAKTASAPAEAPAAAPPPVVQPKPASKGESTDLVAAAESKAKDDSDRDRTGADKKLAEREVTELSKESRQVQDNVSRSQAGGVRKPVPGPSRNDAQNFPNRAQTYELYEQRRVSGKTFERRNGVWYDNMYRSQATTNVRRGTDEYRKLDSGLRTIAESLGGVVVAMWEGKAYRIQ